MTKAKFIFRCKTNPSAPPMEFENYWEAEEMMRHPDYERIDAKGNVIASEAEQAGQRIPFQPSRKTLHLPKK